MSCLDGLHGALFKNYKGEWYCLHCGEQIYNKDLKELREKRENKEKENEDS